MKAEALLRDGRIADLVEQVEGLESKLEHAAAIEQAKGVLMHSLHCGPDAAFAVLVAESQRQNRKLWEVAAELAQAQGDDSG